MIDRKLEPLVKRLMIKYLGELEDDDMVMFVLEHLKDHKGPQKLVEGLEPVRLLFINLSQIITVVFSIDTNPFPSHLGARRRSHRTCHQCLAADHLREYGIRRRASHRKDDGGLMDSSSVLLGRSGTFT